MTSSLSSLLYTARDALGAQSYGLAVTGQNVSNVNTQGYVRRDPILQTRALGSWGTVDVAGLRRATDQFTERRHYEALGLGAASQQQHFHLVGMEALFNDAAGTGIGGALDALFSSFTGLAANPSDPTTRTAVLVRAEAFASRVSSTADALSATRTELLGRAQDVVVQINEKTAAIALLGRQIQLAKAAGDPAADLEDQRAQQLLALSELVDVRTFVNGDGELVVHGTGTTLVEGAVSRNLAVSLDGNGDLQILGQGPSGAGTDVSQYLSGGQLAGIRDARDVDAKQVLQRLDQLAFDVATAVNAQHAAGVGLDGIGGRDLFSIAGTVSGAARSLALSAAMVGQPDRVAAASGVAGLPGGSDNAAALAMLSSATIAGGGTRTASEAYSDLVGDVGTRTRSAETASDMRRAVVGQIYALRESMGGVSLDEEMVALSRYQRAYEAAAMVLNTANELLEELINRVGR